MARRFGYSWETGGHDAYQHTTVSELGRGDVTYWSQYVTLIWLEIAGHTPLWGPGVFSAHNRVDEVSWHQPRPPKRAFFDGQDLSDDAALKAAQALVGRFGDL